MSTCPSFLASLVGRTLADRRSRQRPPPLVPGWVPSHRGLVALFGIRSGGGNILFPGQAGMGGLIASANSDAMTHALQPERSYNFKPGTHSER